ncbi:sodium/solute symporter [bacterium]|nr:sodium/solute symporter [bacterium]
MCQAEEPDAESTVELAGLAPIDWAIIAVYGIATLALGWWYGRQQKSTDEYFTGSGKMNPFLVGVSLFATLLSTISYMSMPGEALGKGPVTMLSLVALPFVFLIVGFVLLPIYMKQHVTSAYELLEARLGLSIRMLGASMFVILRLIWMSLLIEKTSIAMTTMMGIDNTWSPLIALITGVVAVAYTSIGGLRAVIITDAMQTVLLFGGALLVLGTITYDLGGTNWIPVKWNPTWDNQPFFSPDLSVRVTVVGTFLSFLAWFVCTLGGDQTSVQRFMATKDASAARRALATQLTVSVIVTVTLGLIGFALLGYFSAHPEFVPPDLSLKENADKIFPRFIAFHLPPGISGLVVAAMFAAAMSSMDSGVNSITAVVMTDVLDRFGKKPKSERQHVLIARLLAFGIGAFVVLASTQMYRVPGNITEVTQKTSNLLTTPIFGLFFFALFVPSASPKGVWIGAICGTTTAVAIAFSGPILKGLYLLTGLDPAFCGGELIRSIDPETNQAVLTVPDLISFQWIAPVAISVNILSGLFGSIIFPRRAASPDIGEKRA